MDCSELQGALWVIQVNGGFEVEAGVLEPLGCRPGDLQAVDAGLEVDEALVAFHTGLELGQPASSGGLQFLDQHMPIGIGLGEGSLYSALHIDSLPAEAFVG